MKTEDRLKRVFALFLEIVKRDPNLASEIDRVLGQTTSSSQAATAARTFPSSNRRKPAGVSTRSWSTKRVKLRFERDLLNWTWKH